MHFYSIPDWNTKGYATEFEEDAYYELLNTTNFTDELLTRNTEIMNRYDPEGKVDLIFIKPIKTVIAYNAIRKMKT